MKLILLLFGFGRKLYKTSIFYLLIILKANSSVFTINSNQYDNFSGSFIYNNDNIKSLRPFVFEDFNSDKLNTDILSPEIPDVKSLVASDTIDLLSNPNTVTAIGKHSLANKYFFEYIANIPDNLTEIPDNQLKDKFHNSTVYLGATCYKDNQDSKLAMFSYNTGYNLDLQSGFIKKICNVNNKVTTDNSKDAPTNLIKLKSIVIAGEIGNKSADAFSLTSSLTSSEVTTLELTDGLVIAKTGRILGGEDKCGLKFTNDNANTNLKADIYNFGDIIAKTAITIGSDNNKFPLLPSCGTNTELINSGNIEGDVIISGKQHNSVSSFKLTNKPTNSISGNIILTDNSDLKFELINNKDGVINSAIIRVTDINNYGTINSKSDIHQLKITANKISNNLTGIIYGDFIATNKSSNLINEGTINSNSIQVSCIENYGKIAKHSAILAIDANKITNNLTGTIAANLVATANSQIINHGSIISEKIKATKITNYNSIVLTEELNYLANAMETNDYTAEVGSKLYISFADDLSALDLKSAIVNVANSAEFKDEAKIILYSEPNNAASTKLAVTIMQAGSSLQLVQGSIDKTLYSQIFKKDYDYYIIAATNNVVTTDNKIISDLAVVKLYDRRLREAKIRDGQLLSAINYNKEIEKYAAINSYFPNGKKENMQIKGTKISEILNEDIKNTELYKYAVNASDNPDEVIDLILPDSSNSQLIVHSILEDKLSDHINTRIASKNLAFINNLTKQQQKQGINTGDLDEGTAIWSSLSYIHSKDENDIQKTDKVHTNAIMCSLGIDTLLTNDITIGLCYSYGKASAKNKGVVATTNKAKANIEMLNHAVSLYSGLIINDINTDFRITYAVHKHNHQAVNKMIKAYKSSIFGIQTSATHEVELIEDFKADIFASVTFNIVAIAKHETKYNCILPKKNNKLLKLSAGIAVKDTYELDNNFKFNYKISFGYKHIYTMDTKSSRIVLVNSQATDKATMVTIKERIPNKHKFAIDALLNLQPNDNIRFEIDFNLTLGKKIIEYGTGLILRYMF